MDKLKAPFPWFGGKSRVSHIVWDYFGDVANYVEPFAGSLAVLLGRPNPPPSRAQTLPAPLPCPAGLPLLVMAGLQK